MVGIHYRPPGVDCSDFLDVLCSWACNGHCLVLEHFNVPHAEWMVLRCLSGVDLFSRKFLEVITVLALYQHVRRLTYIPAAQESTFRLVLSPWWSDGVFTDHLPLLSSSNHLVLTIHSCWVVPSLPQHLSTPNIWKLAWSVTRDGLLSLEFAPSLPRTPQKPYHGPLLIRSLIVFHGKEM